MISCIVGSLIALIIIYNILYYIQWVLAKPNFKNKVIFITGGSSGIGEFLCKELIKLDAKEIIITARRTKELERVKSECIYPERVSILTLD